MNIRRRTFTTTAAAGALLSAARPGLTQNAVPAPTLLAPSPTLLQERVRQEGVGLAAAGVEVGGVQLLVAGAEQAGQPGPVNADTLFEFGSISKTFTALLLADSVVRGTLKLEGAVEAVLPEGLKLRDSAGIAITWADLATHRSGLPRLPDNLRAEGPDPYADYDRAALWRFLKAWQPTQRRDVRFEYSNLGYGLLGEALALHAGSRFDELLRSRVLQPLGLDDLRLALRGAPATGLKNGHDSQRRPVPNWHFDAIAGAGALVGSARMLARYAQAALGLFDHPLQAAFNLALRPRSEGPSSVNRVALGWLSAPLFDRQVLNHDGATSGFSTSLFLDPQRRRASLVLANAQVVVNDLALHLLEPRVPLRDIGAERRSLERPALEMDAEALGALAGSYALNPQFTLAVRQREGRLFAQATGQGEFELFALATRRFFARVTPLEIQFEGETGTPPALLLLQAGQRLRFVRQASTATGG